MRPLEVATLASHLMTMGWLYFLAAGGGPGLRVAPLLTPLLVTAHAVVEKPRWQMAPAYAQTLVVVALTTTGRWTAVAHNGWLILGGVSLYLVAVVLPYVLAVPRLPLPGGPYAVGTRTVYLVDKQRTDLFGADEAAPRELMVQVWYPAERPLPPSHRAPFIPDFAIGGPAIARRFGFPPFILRHLNLVRTHSYLNAPVAAGDPFPVLTFSHGYLGLPTQNTWQMEELASQGYVVVAPNHTGGAICTVFPDGRVVFGLTDPPAELSLAQAGRLAMAQWAADVSFVLDRLAAWQADPAEAFYGRLNLDRIGCFGHSMGGGTAVQLAYADPRCQALLVLDGWLSALDDVVLQAAFAQPMLHLMSDGQFGRDNGLVAQRLAANGRAAATVLRIRGSGHYDYSDLPLLSPITRLFKAKGPINGRRAAHIINDYTLAFFDCWLRERPSALLEGEARYEEVVPVL